jgi:monoamine oxidase
MKRSLHSRLSKMVREAHAACEEAATHHMPIDEVTDLRSKREKRHGVNRREFLSATGTLVAAATVGSVAWPGKVVARGGRNQPRIVIVGGGIAGLRCAHKLWTERGIRSTVYEWDDRVGGRVETLRNYFDNGQIVEQHGEFISSEHASMLALASRYSLSLDLAGSYPANTSDVYWFKGGYYTQAQLNADWQNFGYVLFKDAVAQAPWPTRYFRYKQTAYQWDHLSVVDWINQYVPGGMASAFGALCYEDVISEYGGPPEDQSALNLIYILGYDDSVGGRGLQAPSSPLLAGTDEKYHVMGGNDQIITYMVNELPVDGIQTGQQLMALKLNSDGTYTCTFQSGATLYDVAADHVVLAIPFTTLRKVDLSSAGLSPLKMTAIQNLSLGTNAKIQIQFKGRPWNKDGFTGTTYADNGAAIAWEATSYQAGSTGILIDFPGGTQGGQLGTKYALTDDEGIAPTAMVNDTLSVLEPIFPGVTRSFNRKAYYSAGVLDPHLLGAYSQYNIGQYTGFSGIEPQQEGNIHFAGEHTSLDFQGFMEGGARSGERVAGEI